MLAEDLVGAAACTVHVLEETVGGWHLASLVSLVPAEGLLAVQHLHPGDWERCWAAGGHPS